MTDFVTVLRARSTSDDPPAMQTKFVFYGRDGLTSQPAGQAYWFKGAEHKVASLDDLADLLERVSRDPYSFVVRGEIIPGTNTAQMLRRKELRTDPKTGEVVPATLREVARFYALLDLENIELPAPDFDQFADPSATVRYVVSLLPSELHGISCWYQFTGSAGIKPGVRLRLVYWLDRALTGEELTWWLGPTGCVDVSLFRPVQPNYTANPIFDTGCKDPLEGRCARSGVIRGERDVVGVPPIERPTPEVRAALRRAGATGDYIPAESFEAALAAIGDHDGGQGCFEPLRSAMWAYASERQGDSNEDELRALLDARMRAAQWDRKVNHHSVAYALDTLKRNDNLVRVVCQRARDRAQRQAERLDKATGFTPIGETEGAQPQPAVALAEGSRKIAEALATLVYAPAGTRKALRVSPGGGKTHAAGSEIVFRTLVTGDVIYSAPTHDKCDEFANYVNKLRGKHIAEVWRGFDRVTSSGKMCERAELVKEVIKAGGTMSDVCGSAKRGFCLHHPKAGGACAYRRQADERPPIWVVPQTLLAYDPPAAVKGADLLILDERWPVELIESTITFDELLAPRRNFRLAFAWTLQNAIESLKPNEYLPREPFTNFAGECDSNRKLEWWDAQKVEIDPRSPDATVDRKALREIEAHNRMVGRRAAFWRELEAFLDSDESTCARMRVAPEGNAIVMESVRKIDPKWLEDRAVILLDATLDQRIAQAFLPGVEIAEDVVIERGRFVTVRQVYDQPVSYTRVVPGTGGCKPGSERYEAQAGNVHACMRAVEAIAFEERQTGGTVALVGPDKMIAHAEATWREWGTRPAGLVTGHFGALRGLNSMEWVSRLISIARPQPPPAEVEAQCRAVFGKHPATLGNGYFPTRPKLLQNPAGVTLATVEAPYHPDPDCDALLRQVLDAEVLQAVHRARPVRRGLDGPAEPFAVKLRLRGGKVATWTGDRVIPLRLDVISSTPTGLPVDQVVTFEEWLAEGSPARLLLARGFWPSDWRGRQVVLRDLYCTAEAARKGFERAHAANPGQTPTKNKRGLLVGKCPGFAPPRWPSYRYRVTGERKCHTVKVDPGVHAEPRAAWESRLAAAGLALDLLLFEPAAAPGK